MKDELLPLGTWVDYNGFRGKVAAIAWLGERYYFLVDGQSVSMIPAFALKEIDSRAALQYDAPLLYGATRKGRIYDSEETQESLAI